MMIGASDILAARILIVDDQEPNVSLLEQLLGEAGYSGVTSTMNRKEVCALHRKNAYDLILLDLQVPGMDSVQQRCSVTETGRCNRPVRLWNRVLSGVGESVLTRAHIEPFGLRPNGATPFAA